MNDMMEGYKHRIDQQILNMQEWLDQMEPYISTQAELNEYYESKI